MLEMGVSGSVGLWVWRVGGLADRERAIFTLLTVSLAHCMWSYLCCAWRCREECTASFAGQLSPPSHPNCLVCSCKDDDDDDNDDDDDAMTMIQQSPSSKPNRLVHSRPALLLLLKYNIHRLIHIKHTITILTGNSAICTMSCADTISMHHHEHYVHCSVLNAHRLLCSKIVRRRGGLLVQLSQFYQLHIRGWWRWMEMLCYGDVDGDQTEPYPGLAAATKWPHFAHLTQMTSNKYKHFPENLLHLQHSWQTHVMLCTMKRNAMV